MRRARAAATRPLCRAPRRRAAGRQPRALVPAGPEPTARKLEIISGLAAPGWALNGAPADWRLRASQQVALCCIRQAWRTPAGGWTLGAIHAAKCVYMLAHRCAPFRAVAGCGGGAAGRPALGRAAPC